MIHSNIPSSIHFSYAAADTEARIYIDNVLVTNEQLLVLGQDKPVSWFREHAYVDVYAWQLYFDKYFAYADTFDEFLTLLKRHQIHSVWWYNAKYDFAHIDYILLTTGWQLKAKPQEAKEYYSLHSDQGQRYTLQLMIPKGESVHQVRFYDFYNFFPSGLAKLLVDFDIRDENNLPVRKLSADYQAGASAEYMEVDVKGLFLLLVKFGKMLEEEFGITVLGAKPQVMTAGSLAKRILLSEMYGSNDPKFNIAVFKQLHPIGYELDDKVRGHGLYRGGICIVNEKYQNTLLSFPIYKFDANSMYPSVMEVMPDLRCCPKRIKVYDLNKYPSSQYVRIFCITELCGTLRKDYVSTWYDNTTKEYTDKPYIERGIDKPFYIFEQELQEMEKWYDIEYSMQECIVVRQGENLYHKFVDKFYKIKSESKTSNPCLFNFAKLCLNSAYGKLAQNPRRLATHRELNEAGTVHLVADGWEIDEDSSLNVIVGAYVTALARIKLLSSIREICGNVKRNFVYCDTDSIHSRVPYEKTDPKTLGAWKYEGCFEHSKYLAPKTYFNMNGDIASEDNFFLHTKGVPQKYVFPELAGKSLRQIAYSFAPDVFFPALMGLNIKGGKALIPCKKMICTKSNVIVLDKDLFYTELDDDKELNETVRRSKYL